MRKKGFTLVELLAVIVILAIIMLIATPIILNIINNVKRNAKIRSAEAYINGIETAIVKKMVDTNFDYNGEFVILDDSNSLYKTGVDDGKIELEMDYKGDLPKTGSVFNIEKGTITKAIVKFDDYEVSYNGKTRNYKCYKIELSGKSQIEYLGAQVSEYNGAAAIRFAIKITNASSELTEDVGFIIKANNKTMTMSLKNGGITSLWDRNTEEDSAIISIRLTGIPESTYDSLINIVGFIEYEKGKIIYTTDEDGGSSTEEEQTVSVNKLFKLMGITSLDEAPNANTDPKEIKFYK